MSCGGSQNGGVQMNMYKKLIIWKDSVSLIKDIYVVADTLPKSEDYNLKSQLKRAIVSVALNIAEGKNRKTAKDFASFLTVSMGSLSEVEAILSICEELGYITVDDALRDKVVLLGKRINSLREKLYRESN
jgi:four helix bundle protein